MPHKFRAIPIENCKFCPYSNDWSSGGVDCRKVRPVRKIVDGLDREKIKTETPEWCPLPNVSYA